MMKIEQEPRTFITTRALDAGIQNVLFADCHSAEEVKEAIRTVLPETPQDGGLHGCSMRRSSGYLLECGNEAWAQAQRDAVIAVMIEKASAMEQLDDILEIKGVDMVQFGPCDYAITLGKPGKSRDTDVMNAQKKMIEKALKKGVQPRVEINSYEQASEYLEMGVRHFCLGADVVIQHTFCKQQGGEMRKLLER